MEAVEMIDALFLRLCTRFSHWFQRLTGWSNFFLAKVGVIFTFASMSVTIFNYFQRVLVRPTYLPEVVICFVASLSVTRAAIVLDKQEGKYWLQPNVKLSILPWPKVVIYLRIALTFSNFWFLPMAIMNIQKAPNKSLQIVYETLGWGLIMFMYFADVHPLPPVKGKVKQWLENFGFLRPVEAEA